MSPSIDRLGRTGWAMCFLAGLVTSGCQTIGSAAKLASSPSASGNTAITGTSLGAMAPGDCPKPSGGVATVECRNYIVGKWIAESEQKCNDYLRLLTAQTETVNLGFGLASSLLSGLSTIFTHMSVVKPLAGAGSIASAGKAEYDYDVLAKQTVGAITGAIRVRRNQARLIITKNLNQSTDERGNPLTDEQRLAMYPLSMAAADVQLFHGDCSLNGGLDQLTISNQLAQAQNDAAAVAGFSDQASTQGWPSSAAGNSSAELPDTTRGTSDQPNILRRQLSAPTIIVPH